jgi:hypothetical protein
MVRSRSRLLISLVAGLVLAAGVAVAVAASRHGSRGALPATTARTATTASRTTTATARGPSVASALALRAHPHVVQPNAGEASPDTTTVHTTTTAVPVGDPNAHAPPLSQIKHELAILNLCGGATSDAFAEPVATAGGPGFVADPGTVQNVGQLPTLTARLDQLGKALHVTIYGISGYRTPQHSVAVGGFADDPHTQGQAEDIGVNNLLRSSAASISEAQLARFGLYRPFDPSDDPSNTEVNHIQLIPAGGVLSVGQAASVWARDPRCQ